MSLLNRDMILQADDLEYEDVYVPEWKGTVRVKALTGRERDDFEASCTRELPARDPHTGKIIRGQYEYRRDVENVRAKLVVRSVIDDQGKRIFRDQDANALGDKNAAPLDRLFDVASRLSRISAEDIEELAGNSAAGQTGDTPSSSPSDSEDSPSPSS
jgi:hypothetical protein